MLDLLLSVWSILRKLGVQVLWPSQITEATWTTPNPNGLIHDRSCAYCFKFCNLDTRSPSARHSTMSSWPEGFEFGIEKECEEAEACEG